MYVKYLGEQPTSVWNTQGRKVEITQWMIFETDKKNGKQYLNRQKLFTEATISDFESQEVKPQIINQGNLNPETSEQIEATGSESNAGEEGDEDEGDEDEGESENENNNSADEWDADDQNTNPEEWDATQNPDETADETSDEHLNS